MQLNLNCDIKTMVKEFFRDNFTPPKNKIATDKDSVGKPRIEFIDLAKGVCIILVVLFHSGIGGPATQALRMPLYFILSGLFFKDYGGLYNLIEKKINKLIIPFVFFFIIEFLVLLFVKVDGIDYFMVFFVWPFRDNYVINYPIWFLLCLFWVNVIYCVINVNVHNLLTQSFCVLLCGIIGYCLSYFHICLPLFISSAFSAIPFFFIGFLLRKMPILVKNKYDKYNLIFAFILLGLGILFCVKFDTPHLAFLENKYEGNPFVIVLLSVGLVVGLFLLCKTIKWLPVISYLGRYSVIVLGLHAIISVHVTQQFFSLEGELFSKLTPFLLTIFLSWLCIPFFVRFAPYFTAQKDFVKLPKRKSSSVAMEVEKS